MRTFACALTLLVASMVLAVVAQTPEPKPAFSGQTDAPPPAKPSPPFAVETVASGLPGAWAVAFLPDGQFLVTQNAGEMRIVRKDGVVSGPIAGVPGIKVVAAQGLHDVVLDPDFARNRLLYFTYFAPPRGEAPATWPIEFFYERVWTRPLAERRTMELGAERVARARLSDDNRRLEHVEVLAEGAERRIVVARDGTPYITGADRFRFYDSDLDGVDHDFTDNPDVRRNFSGRVIRINRDGTIPKDNPWLGRATVLRETFAHGFKDPEGAALHPQTGELWSIDHGPQGGDEINIVRAGRIMGGPMCRTGANTTRGKPTAERMCRWPAAQRAGKTWRSRSITGCRRSLRRALAFYTSDLFPEWKNLFIGAMAGQHLVRLVLNGERVVSEEKLLLDLKQRIREVRQGPEGALYVIAGGSLLRLTPKK